MSLIITATDFSDVAENAIHYSCNLALAQSARLALLHSFVFPVMLTDVPFPASMIDDTQKDAEIRMGTLVSSLKILYPSLEITGHVAYGDLIEVIDQFTSDNQTPWLVVLGNSSTEENKAWFESTINDASKHFRYPILAVPPKYAYRPVSKICFAYDNNPKGHDIALTQLRSFALQFYSKLHIFNASADGLNRDNITETAPAIREALIDANPEFHFEYGVNVNDSVLNFTVANHIDWLAMLPRRHSFLAGLLHSSHTKAIVQNTTVPVLLLHEHQVSED